jgi:hypothetical protein
VVETKTITLTSYKVGEYMHWLGYVAIGMFIGGGLGVFFMALMFAAKQADKAMEDQYEERINQVRND